MAWQIYVAVGVVCRARATLVPLAIATAKPPKPSALLPCRMCRFIALLVSVWVRPISKSLR